MGNLDMHIGEILARNARMYPNGIALIERIPSEHKRKDLPNLVVHKVGTFPQRVVETFVLVSLC